MASVLEFEPRRISVEEYHRMAEAGILDEDERVELLEGVIIPMSPQRPEHAGRIQRLANRLTRRLPPIYEVRVQLPLSLGATSEPEPDLAVVRADQGDPIAAHPSAALLVIEVARESLRKDRELKAAIYARAGIPEYWIVNLAESCTEVYRDPDPAAGGYRTSAKSSIGDQLSCPSIPELRIDVDEIFGD